MTGSSAWRWRDSRLVDVSGGEHSLEATARDRTALERDDKVPARRREDARLWLATGAILPVALGAELRGYSAESRIWACSCSGGVP